MSDFAKRSKKSVRDLTAVRENYEIYSGGPFFLSVA
jgi:hypothetical protein